MPVNVLFCSDALIVDGVTSFVFHLSTALSKGGFNVAVLGRWAGKGFQSRLREHGVRVIQCLSPTVGNVWFDRKAREFAPDVIVTDSRRSFPLATRLKTATGAKVLTFFLDSLEKTDRRGRDVDSLIRYSDAWLSAEPPLLEELDRCMAQGQQAMLFINRRGYAPSVVCRKCGHTMGCTACDVSLTWHAWDSKLHCHYCGQTSPMPERCPACGSPYLRTVGVGTQRVEEEVSRRYPGIEVVRVDNDTTTLKDSHRELINRFRSGKARIMVGTQMIAKGLDFPQVTLVGAVLADLSLNLPDFRSAERSFQLLTQVAGRAGRADKPGRVIIQTYQPEHYAVLAAARQDYRSFFGTEFARRRRDLYPPFTMLVRLLCQAKDEQTARGISAGIYARVEQLMEENPGWKRRVLFYREDEAPIRRIMGRARAQVFLKLLVHPDSEQVLAALQEIAKQDWPGEVALEIDPASMA